MGMRSGNEGNEKEIREEGQEENDQVDEGRVGGGEQRNVGRREKEVRVIRIRRQMMRGRIEVAEER